MEKQTPECGENCDLIFGLTTCGISHNCIISSRWSTVYERTYLLLEISDNKQIKR